MSTLTEIEKATERLSVEQMQELFLFLTARLRDKGGSMPTPRTFTPEQIAAWIKTDEADSESLRGGGNL